MTTPSITSCHGPADGAIVASDRQTVILVGNPNVGKSVLFSKLTGKFVIISNYPGTTVEITRAEMSLDGEIFIDEQDVHDNGVARRVRGADEVELGGMGEHRLGDERPAHLDQLRPGGSGDSRRIVGVRHRILRPALARYLVGVDEHTAT